MLWCDVHNLNKRETFTLLFLLSGIILLHFFWRCLFVVREYWVDVLIFSASSHFIHQPSITGHHEFSLSHAWFSSFSLRGLCPLKGGANEKYVPHLNLRTNLQLSNGRLMGGSALMQMFGSKSMTIQPGCSSHLCFSDIIARSWSPITQVISYVGLSTQRFHFWLEDTRVNVKGRLACIFAWWFNQAAAVMAVVKCLPEGRSGACA